MKRSIMIKGRQIVYNHEVKWYQFIKWIRLELSFVWQVIKHIFKS